MNKGFTCTIVTMEVSFHSCFKDAQLRCHMTKHKLWLLWQHFYQARIEQVCFFDTNKHIHDT